MGLTIAAVVSQLDIEEMKQHLKFNKRDSYLHLPIAFSTMELIKPRSYGRIPGSYGRRAAPLEFPEPKDININMMPFIMGKIESLPEEYQHYWPLIKACHIPKQELGKIGYLTIHEGHVPKGQCQRRPGLHIETPGVVMTQ